MTSESRLSKIESYGNGYALLCESLEKFPEEMWTFRDDHGCWSIHEHLIHIADSEVNSYVRCRRLIAEPGRTLMDYDENRWAVRCFTAIRMSRNPWNSFKGSVRRPSNSSIHCLNRLGITPPIILKTAI